MTTIVDTPLLEPFVVDDAAARRTLRDQIARLDEELGALGAELPAPAEGGGASLVGIEQLERIRDSLAARAAEVRAEMDERGRVQEEARRAREELLLDPAAHPFARVKNEDVGETGCCDWHVRPRFGLLGMLAGWWRVVVSSGCPLSGAGGRLGPAGALARAAVSRGWCNRLEGEAFRSRQVGAERLTLWAGARSLPLAG